MGLGTITNTAEVSAADQADIDSTPGNGDPGEDDQASVDIGVDTLVDIELTKNVNVGFAVAGDQITYSIYVVNHGPSPASSVAVTDILPNAVVLDNWTATQGNYDAGTGIWSVGNLGLNGNATIDMTVTLLPEAAGMTLINTAVASAAEPEADTTNNEDSAQVIVVAPVPTLGETALILLILAMAAAGIAQRRRQ